MWAEAIHSAAMALKEVDAATYVDPRPLRIPAGLRLPSHSDYYGRVETGAEWLRERYAAPGVETLRVVPFLPRCDGVLVPDKVTDGCPARVWRGRALSKPAPEADGSWLLNRFDGSYGPSGRTAQTYEIELTRTRTGTFLLTRVTPLIAFD